MENKTRCWEPKEQNAESLGKEHVFSMDCCKLLFGILDGVCFGVLCEWLSIIDVQRLDAAFILSKLKDRFSSSAFAKFVVYSLPNFLSYKRYNSFIVWSIARGVQLSGVSVTPELSADPSKRSRCLKSTGRSINWLTFRTDQSDSNMKHTMHGIVEHCKSITCAILGHSLNHQVRLEGDGEEETALSLFTSECCSRLTSLTLYCGLYTTRDLARALPSGCSVLTHLELIGSHRTDPLILPLQVAVPSLQQLLIKSCMISQYLMFAIAEKCRALHTLCVYQSTGSGVTDGAGMRAVLQGCPLLQETDVQCAVSIDHALRLELVRRKNLHNFDFRHWRVFSPPLVSDILRESPSLSILHLEHCGWFDDSLLVTCAQHCPFLTFVGLSATRVTTEGIRALARPGNLLRVVRLYECAQLGDEAVHILAQHCPRLEELHSPPMISSTAVKALLEGCPRLEMLLLSCADLDDTAFTRLLQLGQSLGKMQLLDCPSLTVQGVQHALLIESRCISPALRWLYLPKRLQAELEGAIDHIMQQLHIVFW